MRSRIPWRLVDAVRPQRVISVHRECPALYHSWFGNVTLWRDGKWEQVRVDDEEAGMANGGAKRGLGNSFLDDLKEGLLAPVRQRVLDDGSLEMWMSWSRRRTSSAWDCTESGWCLSRSSFLRMG